jgi:hypothetical protein
MNCYEHASAASQTRKVPASQDGGKDRKGKSMKDDASIASVSNVRHDVGQSWFVVDKEGLRKTLSRKGKAFAIYELLQNAYDEAPTQVDVTLGAPDKHGNSTLTCTDNSPRGYADLSQAHTMFAESKKKTDEKKRGRFNVGEKHVLALCDTASITSTSGRTVFMADGKRRHEQTRTKAGTRFEGVMPLTPKEYDEMAKNVGLVMTPIPTTFNGELLKIRKLLHEFEAKLPTEIADENGVLRSRLRLTKVRLYESSRPMLYEMGMPVVDIDCKWSVDIQQKVPLNIERDNVSPAYLRQVLGAILNQKGDDISDEDAAAAWVSTAMESKQLKPEALKKVYHKRFGEGAVLFDGGDLGSNREAVAKGRVVVPRGAITAHVRKSLFKAGVKKAGEEFSTKASSPDNVIPDNKLTKSQRRFKTFIEQVAPLVLDHPLKRVQFAHDKKSNLLGCTHWSREHYEFTVNVGHHDVDDWKANYDLFIHELAHFHVQRNDHLFEGFWRACSDIGAKLAQVALDQPELFPTPVRQLIAA